MQKSIQYSLIETAYPLGYIHLFWLCFCKAKTNVCNYVKQGHKAITFLSNMNANYEKSPESCRMPNIGCQYLCVIALWHSSVFETSSFVAFCSRWMLRYLLDLSRMLGADRSLLLVLLPGTDSVIVINYTTGMLVAEWSLTLNCH